MAPGTYSGRYSRLVQAAHLLGRVIRNISEPSTGEYFHDEEAQQLRRTLYALLRLSDIDVQTQSRSFCTQKSLCYR
jgi:hypothetical protein